MGARASGWMVAVVLGAVSVAVAVAGCRSGTDEAEEAPPAAAWVGSDTLTADALAALLVLGQPLPVTEAVARDLARHWVAVAALAAVGLDALAGPEWTRTVVWPDHRAAVLAGRLDEGTASLREPSEAEVDAAYAGPRFRLPARIVRRTSAQDHPDERRRQREAAFAIHEALREGAPWAEVVAGSDDDEGREQAGLLGLVQRGDLGPGLEGAVYALEPGQISPVLETEEGYEIAYRPRLDEVRELFARELAAARADDARQVRVDSLVAAARVQFVDGAEGRLAALAEPGARGTGRALARWEGGRLDDTMAVRYLATLDPDDRARIRADPSEASDLLPAMAAQELTWQALGAPGVDAAGGMRAAAADWTDRLAGYDDVVADPLAYMEAVVARRRAPVTVPPTILGTLEARGEGGSISSPGIQAAVERARRMVAGAQATPGGEG